MKKTYGPYVRKDGRSIVVHYDTDTQKTTSQSYPRYMLEESGEKLDSKLQVDHVNNDKTDNRLDNFQMLTPGDNIRKSSVTEYLDWVCPECGQEFKLRAKRYRYETKNKRDQFYCSRRCSSRAGGIASGKSRGKNKGL